MTPRATALAACALLALAATLAACGGGDERETITGKRLVVYSSLPLQGPSRQVALDIADAERLALRDAGGKAGDFSVQYVSLDDATAKAGGWDPGQVSANARKAASDRRTIAYLGELDPTASAVSIPILNQAGILAVSPGDTALGLTRAEGAGMDEPEKYYPEGRRTFGRVIPADHVQARALAAYMADQDVRRLYVLNDGQAYGAGLAAQVAARARDRGIQVAASERADLRSDDQRALTAKVVASGADAVFFGGALQDGVPELFRELHAAAPRLDLFAPAALSAPAFTGGLRQAQSATFVAKPTLDPRLYPPAGQEFFRDFEAKLGRVPAPEAAYGYEAMGAVLEAIDAAGERGNDRRAVRDAFFDLDNRASVVGTYSIDDNGDTTLPDYGGYRVVGGRLVFDRFLKAEP